MDITIYEELTGLTPNSTLFNANLIKTKLLLEDMLGYSLDTTDGYTEDTRIYSYFPNDRFYFVDPAVSISEIQLVSSDDPLTVEDYRLHTKNGFIKYIERCNRWCNCLVNCDCKQLSVTGVWLFEELPQDLLLVWAEMIKYNLDPQNDIKSQTLGTHRWERFDKVRPEKEYVSILKKYVGGNGSLRPLLTL